jgi:dienelactone hydrolase
MHMMTAARLAATFISLGATCVYAQNALPALSIERVPLIQIEINQKENVQPTVRATSIAPQSIKPPALKSTQKSLSTNKPTPSANSAPTITTQNNVHYYITNHINGVTLTPQQVPSVTLSINADTPATTTPVTPVGPTQLSQNQPDNTAALDAPKAPDASAIDPLEEIIKQKNSQEEMTLPQPPALPAMPAANPVITPSTTQDALQNLQPIKAPNAKTKKKKPKKPALRPKKKGQAKPASNKTPIIRTSTTPHPTSASHERITPQATATGNPLSPPKVRIENIPPPYGLWIKTDKGAGKRPTIIALHGCGGLYSIIAGENSQLTPRYETMIRVFNAAGFHVFLPDSFTPRGKHGNCTEPLSEWNKQSQNDRRDVAAALAWLATRDDVDMTKIALFGWSYGATTMISAINLGYTDVAIRNIQPRVAIGFYPSCSAYLDPQKPFKLAAPLLILVGENDTWTPAKPCKQLEQRTLQTENWITLKTYPDTYHDFDAPGTPLYVRLDVAPADGKPGGITAGGNADSRAAAYKEILMFLQSNLSAP